MGKKINKISLITTVFNEETEIGRFIESILNQSTVPEEIVIVDGRSTDKTVDRINDYRLKIKEKGIKFKLISRKGNIATGRNEAIKNAKNNTILVSDVGCILHRDWVKNISAPFEDKKVDVVAGFYEPKANSVFEKCLATYTSVMPGKIDPENFLPSSRSVAFRKSAWKKVSRYPEWLDTCEDLFFARELKRNGFKFKFQKNALVFWPQRKNLNEAFKQFYNYAKGDGTARYIRPNTPFLFLRYVLGLVLLFIGFITQSTTSYAVIILLLVGYTLWSINKNYKYVKDPLAFIYLPTLQFMSDLAVISGMSIGFSKSFSVKKSN